MSISYTLVELARRCEQLELQFPDYRLVMSEVDSSRWSWLIEPKGNADVDHAETELAAISCLIVRVLDRAGMDFDTPMGCVEDSIEAQDGWFRLLFFAFDYVEAFDVLDLPLVDKNQRELIGNPFFLSRLLLIEIAGLLDGGEKLPAILNRIIQQPKWPRFLELEWSDDEKAVNADQPNQDMKFTEGHLETVREIISQDCRMKMSAILNIFRAKNGCGIGTVRLQTILDHIRQNFPDEYKVPARARKS